MDLALANPLITLHRAARAGTLSFAAKFGCAPGNHKTRFLCAPAHSQSSAL